MPRSYSPHLTCPSRSLLFPCHAPGAHPQTPFPVRILQHQQEIATVAAIESEREAIKVLHELAAARGLPQPCLFQRQEAAAQTSVTEKGEREARVEPFADRSHPISKPSTPSREALAMLEEGGGGGRRDRGAEGLKRGPNTGSEERSPQAWESIRLLQGQLGAAREEIAHMQRAKAASDAVLAAWVEEMEEEEEAVEEGGKEEKEKEEGSSIIEGGNASLVLDEL